MEFIFTADIKFTAKNINDAFIELSKHFKRLSEGKDSTLVQLGEMHINLRR